MPYHFQIFSVLNDLPNNWDEIVASKNVLLSKNYFEVLQNSKPNNMECYAVAFFEDENLIGGALFQYLDFQLHNTFQKKNSWCDVKNFLGKKFTRNVLVIGNNMLTGQNGFHFNFDKISASDFTILLEKAVQEFQQNFKKTSLIIYKDYQKSVIEKFNKENLKNYFQFSVQPNMILEINKNWVVFEDYLAAFSKKYRDRAKSARRKFNGLEKRELDLQEIEIFNSELNALYHNVAENAPFNTFFLAENHFFSLKKKLKENFKIFGYFDHDKLIGFYTFIINKETMDTYFLGYDKDLQKPKQLYLNMLLDMVAFGIENNFEKIVFGRTALEIKSTIGAEPVDIYGKIKHSTFLINKLMPKIFPNIEPKVEWLQRKPFK
ncbi:peptidogalycan biosysnthesis protein [Frigoriflavimonas asaccharolytica]|uniref:Putative N-acyltransferase n=1 Tax=Frigoriflavimonas asaccharolytica TaxID=2735899 RepID=A0A8J8G884_9FLAO|nr:peptidogalycan biosysnthesis protein [Frigoriflavimonas asaccharolytica]NRS91319.1 putative N-acyltransferase [Frigoriflavimonas asaccharolytica]